MIAISLLMEWMVRRRGKMQSGSDFAIAAILPLLLDLTKTLGFFVLAGVEFNLTAVAALLGRNAGDTEQFSLRRQLMPSALVFAASSIERNRSCDAS